MGLKDKVDIQFLNDHPIIDAAFLNKNIITDVVVSSMTSFENATSLPIATHYVPKEGKKEADVKSFILYLVRTLQIREACTQQT